MDKERLNNMIWWFCFLGMGLLCISLVIGSKAILEANLSDITQGDMSVFVSGMLLSLGIMFGLVLMFAWDGRALQKRLKALEEKQNKSSWIFKIDTYKPSRTGAGNGKQMMDELKKDLQKKVKKK